MRKTVTAIFSITCLLLAACDVEVSTSLGDNEVDLEAEAARVMALETEWSRIYGEKNIDAIMDLFVEDSVLIAPGSPPVVGKPAIRSSTASMLAAEGLSVEWTPMDARVAPGGDMAFDYGTSITRLPDGTTVPGAYLVVWVKVDGEWKVAADIFN